MNRPNKAKAAQRVRACLEAIPPLRVLSVKAPEFKKWRRDVELAIEHTFGKDTRHQPEFCRINYYAGINLSGPQPDPRPPYLRGLSDAETVLESFLDEIAKYWEDDPSDELSKSSARQTGSTGNSVFLIHGHDNGAKNEVARFLERLELDVVVLHEQPDQGRTIMEKFEQYTNVEYVVALLTPDDVGRRRDSGTLHTRARQNVIFELGFFTGHLGRHNVCALTKGDIEIPSDYSGVIYVRLDGDGAWKLRLVKELRAAGLAVDANKAY